jgi:hypothetical protein
MACAGVLVGGNAVRVRGVRRQSCLIGGVTRQPWVLWGRAESGVCVCSAWGRARACGASGGSVGDLHFHRSWWIVATPPRRRTLEQVPSVAACASPWEARLAAAPAQAPCPPLRHHTIQFPWIHQHRTTASLARASRARTSVASSAPLWAASGGPYGAGSKLLGAFVPQEHLQRPRRGQRGDSPKVRGRQRQPSVPCPRAATSKLTQRAIGGPRREYPTDAAAYELLEDCGRGVSATVRTPAPPCSRITGLQDLKPPPCDPAGAPRHLQTPGRRGGCRQEAQPGERHVQPGACVEILAARGIVAGSGAMRWRRRRRSARSAWVWARVQAVLLTAARPARHAAHRRTSSTRHRR